GNSWTTAGAGSPVLQGGTARVTSPGAPTSIVFATIATSAADVHVATSWITPGANGWGGLALRWTDSRNFFYAGYRANGGLALFRVQDGQWTRLVGAPVTATSASPHQIEAVMAGAALQVYWDGALLLQSSDEFNRSVDRHGLAWANGVDTTSAYDTFR